MDFSSEWSDQNPRVMPNEPQTQHISIHPAGDIELRILEKDDSLEGSISNSGQRNTKQKLLATMKVKSDIIDKVATSSKAFKAILIGPFGEQNKKIAYLTSDYVVGLEIWWR
jgi:hypothetical protein